MSKMSELTRRAFLLATILTPVVASAVMDSITSAQAQETISNNKRPNFLFFLLF